MNYKIISYPDGQINASVDDLENHKEVKMRINSYTDLFAAKSMIRTIETSMSFAVMTIAEMKKFRMI